MADPRAAQAAGPGHYLSSGPVGGWHCHSSVSPGSGPRGAGAAAGPLAAARVAAGPQGFAPWQRLDGSGWTAARSLELPLFMNQEVGRI